MSFFSSITNKAQAAINSSPLASHIPPSISSRIGGSQHGNAGASQQQAPADQSGQGGKSHTFGTLHHQFRSLQMQYSSMSPVQRIVTTQKGVALAFDSVCREAKAQSRELYTWGQHEDADIKDVSDRLAYLNFVHGALSETLANNLDKSRATLKALRDAENALAPKRNVRANLETQIGKIEYEQPRGQERRLAEMKQQLKAAEAEDATAEREIEVLKRKAMRESEQLKWASMREYGEKLVLLAEASNPIIEALPPIPPTAAQPYAGAQSTAATRASLQSALDNYKPGILTHSFQPSAADLSKSDSRSFGETHASELSSIAANANSGVTRPISPPVSPPVSGGTPPLSTTSTYSPPAAPAPAVVPVPVHATSHIASEHSPQSPPINPAALNNTPASIPTPSKTSSTNSAIGVPPAALRVAPDDVPEAQAPPPAVEPTIAETGVPVTAGAAGPGPASGSLHDLKAYKQNSGSQATPSPSSGIPAYTGGGAAIPQHESAEEEKRRLQREERDRLLTGETSGAGGSQPAGEQKQENSEEEKKRLEREQREWLLQEGAYPGKDGHPGDAAPPPYQDF